MIFGKASKHPIHANAKQLIRLLSAHGSEFKWRACECERHGAWKLIRIIWQCYRICLIIRHNVYQYCSEYYVLVCLSNVRWEHILRAITLAVKCTETEWRWYGNHLFLHRFFSRFILSHTRAPTHAQTIVPAAPPWIEDKQRDNSTVITCMKDAFVEIQTWILIFLFLWSVRCAPCRSQIYIPLRRDIHKCTIYKTLKIAQQSFANHENSRHLNNIVCAVRRITSK